MLDILLDYNLHNFVLVDCTRLHIRHSKQVLEPRITQLLLILPEEQDPIELLRTETTSSKEIKRQHDSTSIQNFYGIHIYIMVLQTVFQEYLFGSP